MLNETNQLFHYILHSGNVLPTLDHRRLLELVEGLDWPEPGNPPPSTYYDLKGYRSQMLIGSRFGENIIFSQEATLLMYIQVITCLNMKSHL